MKSDWVDRFNFDGCISATLQSSIQYGIDRRFVRILPWRCKREWTTNTFLYINSCSRSWRGINEDDEEDNGVRDEEDGGVSDDSQEDDNSDGDDISAKFQDDDISDEEDDEDEFDKLK
ncbi:hypothetical protein QL285_003389 [Trifolium repens]|nr:hypothetical protein QL285_003389 [Trifolium repens]